MRTPLSSADWRRPPDHPIRGLALRSDEEVWHYTNLTALEGMLNSGTLWATSHRWLNDPAEVRFGVADFRRAWEELSPGLKPNAPAAQVGEWLAAAGGRTTRRNIFFFSASTLGDSLPHWQGYGGDVAIRFESASEFRFRCVGESCEFYTPDFIPPIFWRPVSYGTVNYDFYIPRGDPVFEFIDSALDSFSALNRGRVRDEVLFYNALEHNYLNAVCMHKSGAFEHESEVRLLAISPPGRRFIASRDGRLGRMTYVSLATAGDEIDRHCVRETRMLPITHVRVRPGPGARDIERCVRRLLSATGYGHVTTDRSSIPYR